MLIDPEKRPSLRWAFFCLPAGFLLTAKRMFSIIGFGMGVYAMLTIEQRLSVLLGAASWLAEVSPDAENVDLVSRYKEDGMYHLENLQNSEKGFFKRGNEIHISGLSFRSENIKDVDYLVALIEKGLKSNPEVNPKTFFNAIEGNDESIHSDVESGYLSYGTEKEFIEAVVEGALDYARDRARYE